METIYTQICIVCIVTVRYFPKPAPGLPETVLWTMRTAVARQDVEGSFQPGVVNRPCG